MKKLLKFTLAASMAMSAIPLQAQANEAGGDVVISENGTEVTIGNGYLSRTFTTEGGQLRTKAITNSRINEVFEPASGSEDFIINLVDDTQDVEEIIIPPSAPLSREGWSVQLYNAQGVAFDQVDRLFDGDPDTYVDQYQNAGMPITLEIDLGSVQKVGSFSFQKRPGYSDPVYGINGTMGEYKLYVSEDGEVWEEAGAGEFTEEDYNLHEEDGLYNVGDLVYGNFDQIHETRYVRIDTLSDALGTTEEFTGAEIMLYEDQASRSTETILPSEEIGRDGWDITLAGAAAANLIDGIDATTAVGSVNDEIIIDLGSVCSVGSFSYQKRPGYHQSAWGVNGTMGEYALFVSTDGSEWTPAGTGSFTREEYGLHEVVLDEPQTSDGITHPAGTTLYNVGNLVYGNFDQIYETRYVKIVPKSDVLGGTDEFHGAEIRLYADQKIVPEIVEEDHDIRASELSVEDVSVEDNTLRVSFAPFALQGVNWDIDMVAAMEDGKHYMNTWLEISADDPSAAAINYIDLDHFVIPEDASDVWSIPDESQISSMWIGKHELMLGQPIYADGLFFGSEFPAQETDVEDDAMKIRYYSGKTIAKMAEDGQDVRNGNMFRTWNNVVGAAQGTETAVVQTDFFDYIEDIATPSTFRKQYNSWYDNMMNISDSSIEASFLGAEKGLAQNGVEPLDSYVVDDGWNNYNNEIGGVNAPAASGTTQNQTGFWEFNSKFPNELYTSTELTDKLQSSFGVWVGPQGGYNYFGGFSRYLEAMGTGYVQHNSALGDVVCTGSRKYIQNFEDRFVDYQTRFDIDYWKWDGFASRPCNAEDHDHMVGGDDNMYFTSDMWEAWTDLFEHARAARAAEGKGLWINATCYVNLSPWLLQWVNTIWVQDSGDTGQAGDTSAARHQQKIYYRDDVYYSLYMTNEIQFPLKNIYNHDPIYGVSDASSATTDVFREFLFDNAMRGTAFWELYYSPSIMDDAKWQVTADALDFAESNHEVLKNAKLFTTEGSRPSEDVYGYSAWNDEQGFVSFVNPTAEEQTFALTLNDLVGVPQGMHDLQQVRIYPYASQPDAQRVSYGDTLEVTLSPFSSQIYQFGITDEEAPQVVSARIIDEDTIEVRFDERVNAQIEAEVNGSAAEAQLSEDYRTVKIAAEGVGETASLKMSGIRDIYGNAAEEYRADVRTSAEIASASHAEDVSGAIEVQDAEGNTYLNLRGNAYALREDGISGTTDFSVSLTLNTIDTDTVLLKQGEDYTIGIDADGYVKASVGGVTLSSQESVTTVTEKASGTFGTSAYQETKTRTDIIGKVNDGQNHTVNLVREANGMIKLYVDGSLSASAYEEDRLNEQMSGSAITLGDASYSGYVGDVIVRNSAIYYDDAQQYAQDHAIALSAKPLSKEGWSAEACSEHTSVPGTGGDGAAMDVVDGNNNTYWHSNYSGGDTCENTHTLTIDFGQTVTFDNLEYVARPGAGNGTWTSVTIIGIDEEGNEQTLMEEQEVTLTNNMAVFAFASPQTFRAVRFELTGTGGYGSAAEINATCNVEQVNISEIAALQQEAQQLLQSVDPADYTAESYDAFKVVADQIAQLNPFVDEGTDVSALRTALHDAHQALVPISGEPASDAAMQALRDMVEKAIAMGSADAVLNEAITNAQAVLAKEAPTATEVVTALLDLSEAMQDLGGSADVDALRADVQATIDFINENILNDVEGLRPGKVQALKDAVQAAQDVVNDPGATADQLKAANKAMSKAAQELWEIVTKAELEALIEAANGYLDGDYTAESLDALQTAIEAAQAIAINDDATTAEVTEAITNLSSAIAGLESIRLDKSALEHEIDLVNEMLANLDNYVPSSVEGLADKLADAQNVLENAATQAEIDEAVKTLREARLNARTKADVSALEELVAYVNSLDLRAYTSASAQPVIQDLARANRMLANAEVTQEEVDDMVEKLQASVDELVEVNNSTSAEDTTNTAAALQSGMYAGLLAVSAGLVLMMRRRRTAK